MIVSKFNLLVSSFVLIALTSLAQTKFSVNGQYMNRAEYRHGYSTLALPNQDAAFFISQRARLMTNLELDKAEIFVSIQDIRTWGNTANAAIDNNGLLSVHEAWAALQLSKKLNLKVGRQEIAYDEDRIFGSLDWAMQARRHDAAILKYYDSLSKTSLHFGFAYNQNGEQLSGTVYNVPNNYKTFQYLYFNKTIGKIKSSFLFLNNGIQIQKPGILPVDYKTVFTQTFGPRVVYKEIGNKLSWNASFYYQTGTNNQNRSLSGYDFLGEVAFEITKEISITGGLELLSGTDEIGANPTKSNSFTPFYGTNHRFNGYMDYFFVGNHVNGVGLHDYYVKGSIKKTKVIYGIGAHFFSSGADVQNDLVPVNAAKKNLGTELDLTFSYNLSDAISIQGGYSQMFATRSMEFLKNVPDGSNQLNNWAYLMLIVRPGTPWPKTGLKM